MWMTLTHSYKVTVTTISVFYQGEEECSYVLAFWKGRDLFQLYNRAINLYAVYPMRGIYMLPKIRGVPCYCTVPQTHHRMLLASFSLSSQSQQGKKPITSADTVWQYCHNGWRHMSDSSVRPAEDLSISVHFYHSCHYFLSVFICNVWMMEKHSPWAQTGSGCLKI